MIWVNSKFLGSQAGYQLLKLGSLMQFLVASGYWATTKSYTVADDETVPEGLEHCLGHLGLSDIHLGIASEVIHYYQNILFFENVTIFVYIFI